MEQIALIPYDSKRPSAPIRTALSLSLILFFFSFSAFLPEEFSVSPLLGVLFCFAHTQTRPSAVVLSPTKGNYLQRMQVRGVQIALWDGSERYRLERLPR